MRRQVARARRLIRIGTSDEFGWQQVVLVAIVVLAPAAFLWCASLAGGQVSPWLALLLALTAALVIRAESALLAILWLVLGVLWVAVVPSPFTWWSVPAAGVALLGHVSAGVPAGAPLTTVWPAATIRRYRRRIGVVLAITGGVAVLAQITVSLRTSGAAWLVVVALLLVAGWLGLGWRLDAESSDDGAAPEVPVAPAPSVRWDE